MENAWNKKKRQYWIGVLVFSFFLLSTFIGMPEYTQDELTTKQVTLSKKPVFKETHGKGKSYWVELFFLGDPKKYEISGIDYKFINYGLFINNLLNGDRVTIKVKGEKIYSFEKNGIEYMNFEKARYYKSRNKVFSRGIFITGLICCIFPLLFSSNPVLAIGDQKITIRFGWVLFISIIVAFIILSEFVGLQYLSSHEFIN